MPFPLSNDFSCPQLLRHTAGLDGIAMAFLTNKQVGFSVYVPSH